MDTSSHKDDNSIAADAGTLNSHENAADHADKDGDEPSGDGKGDPCGHVQSNS